MGRATNLYSLHKTIKLKKKLAYLDKIIDPGDNLRFHAFRLVRSEVLSHVSFDLWTNLKARNFFKNSKN